MAEQLGTAAVALRLRGASWADIAETLDFASPTAARNTVMSILAEQVPGPESREALREQEAARLELILQGVMEKATIRDADAPPVDDDDQILGNRRFHPEHLAATKVAVGLIDRLIRLRGLDAPTEITVHTPTRDALERWVGTIVGQGVKPLKALEASVIDDDEEEDEDEDIQDAEVVEEPVPRPGT